MNHLELVVETMKLTLQALATKHPDWLLTISLPYWYDRYDQQLAKSCLPITKEQRDTQMRALGVDICYLLDAIGQANLPDLASLPEVRALQRIWQKEYGPCSDDVWRREDAK